jgi:hypothetical protein
MAKLKPSPEDTDLSREAEVDEVLAEFEGDARAAIRALLDDQTTLLADADRSVSRGYLRGLFSLGARPLAVDDEP